MVSGCTTAAGCHCMAYRLFAHAFYAFQLQTDRQTDRRTDITTGLHTVSFAFTDAKKQTDTPYYKSSFTMIDLETPQILTNNNNNIRSTAFG